jgi:hypothetical protein
MRDFPLPGFAFGLGNSRRRRVRQRLRGNRPSFLARRSPWRSRRPAGRTWVARHCGEARELSLDLKDVTLDRQLGALGSETLLCQILDPGELLFEQAEFLFQERLFLGARRLRGVGGLCGLELIRGILRKLMLAKTGEFWEVDEFAKDARVLDARFLDPAEPAERFCESEDRLGGVLALAVELGDDRFVITYRALWVAGEFFVDGRARDILRPLPGKR